MTAFHFRLLGWIVLLSAWLACALVTELRGLSWWTPALLGGGALGAWILFVVADDYALQERTELDRQVRAAPPGGERTK